MTEEKKDVYQIKKETVKQFLIIVGGSFIGCFLAVLLAGQLVKPKFPPCHRPLMPPPAYAQMHKFPHKHHMKNDFKRFECKKRVDFKKIQEQKLNGEVKAPVPVR